MHEDKVERMRYAGVCGCMRVCVGGVGGKAGAVWWAGGLVSWTSLLFPWCVQTLDHTRPRSPTAPLSNIRHNSLLLTHGSQRELEGHDGIEVKVNLKACDEGH